MNVFELNQVAERLEGLIRRADTFGKSRETILEEIRMIADDYQGQADRLDKQIQDSCA
jgi:hypothetical protein